MNVRSGQGCEVKVKGRHAIRHAILNRLVLIRYAFVQPLALPVALSLCLALLSHQSS